MPLINWHWLEDLLTRACELEIRRFGEAHGGESFFAFCLEFDGLEGTLRLSYGTRAAVDAVVSSAMNSAEGVTSYRAVELRPENWQHRDIPILDAEGYWSRARPLLDQYRELMADDLDADQTEFYWLRFEYLTESVVQRLIDRDAFRHLRRDREFLAYSAGDAERLEELEERIAKLYPNYRRATSEWVDQARSGYFRGITCDGPQCGDPPVEEELTRCTGCHLWFCPTCRAEHRHPELTLRQSFFE